MIQKKATRASTVEAIWRQTLQLAFIKAAADTFDPNADAETLFARLRETINLAEAEIAASRAEVTASIKPRRT